MRLETCPLDHEKAVTLQNRIRKHAGQWLVFVDDPRVPPTNNLAERTLRPLVVLRKITFGHRSEPGATRMAKLMTIQETAKHHRRRPTDIFYRLYTRPPNQVLRYLYAGVSSPHERENDRQLSHRACLYAWIALLRTHQYEQNLRLAGVRRCAHVRFRRKRVAVFH